jgi:hypothetical protein
MSSYQNAYLEGFVWDSTSDRSKLVNILARMTKTDPLIWRNIYDTVLPLYREWVGTGQVPVYVSYTVSGTATIKKLTSKSSILEKNIRLFMDSLYAGVMAGQLPAVMLDPGLPGKIKENLAVNVYEEIRKKAKDVGSGASKIIKGVTVPIIIGATVIVLIIYSPALKRGVASARKIGGKVKGAASRLKQKFQ